MGASWRPVDVPDLPDGLILFDGVCVLCSTWVKFILERDEAAQFRFVAIQGRQGHVLAARLGIDPEEPETNAVILGGRAFFKSDAAIEVLSRLPRWSWTRGLAFVPRPLRNWTYDHVARRRYRFFGRSDTCLVPTPDIARRFILDPPDDT